MPSSERLAIAQVSPFALEAQTEVGRYVARTSAELARRGWSDEDLAKVAGGNLLRVMAQTEVVAQQLRSRRQPSTATIAELDR